MTNILSGLQVTETIEEDVDSLGGAQTLDTNVYPITIKALFVGKAASEAMSVTLHGTTSKGIDFKTTQYITSGKAKGGKPYYERGGKKHFLPGYNIINSICILACGKSIAGNDKGFEQVEVEDKTVMLYDYDLKKEVPTVVPMITEALGKTIALGIQKQIVDKNKKNDATGEYEATGETREENEVVAVFSADTGLTLLETKAGEEEPVFLTKWKEKRIDTVINKSKGLEGSTGAIGGGAAKAKPSKSLFS